MNKILKIIFYILTISVLFFSHSVTNKERRTLYGNGMNQFMTTNEENLKLSNIKMYPNVIGENENAILFLTVSLQNDNPSPVYIYIDTEKKCGSIQLQKSIFQAYPNIESRVTIFIKYNLNVDFRNKCKFYIVKEDNKNNKVPLNMKNLDIKFNTKETESKNSCPKLSSPRYGYVFLTETKIRSTAYYECSHGSTLSINEPRICMPDGTWSSSEPECILKENHCKKLSQINNGKINISGYKLGDTVSYTCNDGYYMDEEITKICLPSGKWNIEQEPICKKKENFCPKLVQPKNGKISDYETKIYSQAKIKCNKGYEVSHEHPLICLPNKKWSKNVPICTPIYKYCDYPKPPVNGRITNTEPLSINKKVYFECDAGYQLSSNTPRTCLLDKKLSENTPTCNIIDNFCHKLPKIKNGSIKESSRKIHSITKYKCDLGYKLSSRFPRICKANKKWSLSTPSCKLIINFCNIPKSPLNGKVIYKDLKIHAVATYKCSEGYSMKEKKIEKNTCTKDRVWKEQTPKCTKIEENEEDSTKKMDIWIIILIVCIVLCPFILFAIYLLFPCLKDNNEVLDIEEKGNLENEEIQKLKEEEHQQENEKQSNDKEINENVDKEEVENK